MVKQTTLQSNLGRFEDGKLTFNEIDVENHIVTPTRRGQLKEVTDNTTIDIHTYIRLNLQELTSLEVVERQYESRGVIFQNSLAVQPSNPAFPSKSGLTVLMGSPRSEFLEATFLRPVNSVSACVTSSQRLVLSAYDRDRQLLSQDILPNGNLADSDADLSSNILLSVSGKNIHSVNFYALDGQFTIHDFWFCI